MFFSAFSLGQSNVAGAMAIGACKAVVPVGPWKVECRIIYGAHDFLDWFLSPTNMCQCPANTAYVFDIPFWDICEMDVPEG